MNEQNVAFDVSLCIVSSVATCTCADGYLNDPSTGLCTIQQCLHHVCLNNQPCGGATSCDCQQPYSGDNCQTGASCLW